MIDKILSAYPIIANMTSSDLHRFSFIMISICTCLLAVKFIFNR